MNKTKKPLSFSLCPLNIAYVKEQVEIQKKTNSRYGVSQWGDDLITHLRLKAEGKTELVVNDKKPKASVKRFKAPTVDQVREYCDSRCNKIDAETFVDHYTTNGWVQGKNKPVKCWKACIRTWEKKDSGKQKQLGKTSGNLSACEDFVNG